MKLGENIFKLRKEYNLSQEQLAEKINVTRQTISNWELGETAPNPEQLKLLSKTLKVSIDELLNNGNIVEAGGSEYIQNIVKDKEFKKGKILVEYIESYFKDNGGSCR